MKLKDVKELRAEVNRLTLELFRLQQQYDELSAGMIVHRGQELACSEAMCAAYFDERRRADKLVEVLREARDAIEDWAGYVSEYFREKHDLDGDLAKIDILLREQEEGHEQ